MKILVFNAYYYPEKASSLYLNEDIYQAFIKAGNDIVLYCPTPCRGIDKETRKKYKRIKKEFKYDGKLIIKRFGLYKEPKSTFWRFVRYYFLTWKFFFKGLFTKADIIFSQSTPPIVGLALSKLKFWKRIPIIYNLQDIFPDSLVNTGLTHKGSLLWKIGRRIENKTYKCVDKIVVISKDFKNNIIVKGVILFSAAAWVSLGGTEGDINRFILEPLFSQIVSLSISDSPSSKPQSFFLYPFKEAWGLG